jgi:hypothetical protein
MEKNENQKGKITDKNGVIRFDFQFSYWVVIWFIFYYIIALQKERSPLTQKFYEYMNPLVSLFIAFIENMIVFIILLFYSPPFSLIVKYIIMVILLKIIPICLLLYSSSLDKQFSFVSLRRFLNCSMFFECPAILQMSESLFLRRSFFSFLVVFAVYNLYLFWNETNIIDVYMKTIHFIFTEKNKTFLFYYMERIKTFLF